MFTVRIIYPNNTERIIEAKTVTKEVFPSKVASESYSQQIRLELDYENTSEIVDEGDIYIMNENGKTVAVYYFGEKMREICSK